jgi:Lon protease-like protein
MTVRLPIFPLHTVLFPGDLLPLHIFEPRYRLMLSRWGTSEPCFGVVLTRRGSEVGDHPEIHATGTSAINVEQVTLPDGRSNILVRGARRFRVLDHDWDESYIMATIDWLDPENALPPEKELAHRVQRIQRLLALYLKAFNRATGQQTTLRTFDEHPVEFAYSVASTLPMPVEARQRLLEATPPHDLLAMLEETIRRETALLVKTGAYAFLPGHPGSRFTSN